MGSIHIKDLIGWAFQTPADPRAVLRRFIDLNWPMAIYIQAAIGIAIIGVLISYLVMLVMPPLPTDDQIAVLQLGPLASFLIQITVTGVMVLLTYTTARTFKGTGSLSDTTAAIVWLQFVLMFAQLAQAIFVLTIPVLGAFIFLILFVLMFYLLVNFICEVHGFQSPGLVFLTCIGVLFLISMVLSTILISMGLVPNLEAANV